MRLLAQLSKHTGGVAAGLAGKTIGGMLCRRLVPAAILFPVLIGWLWWKGQQAGLYSVWTGSVIMAVSSGILLTALTVWTALAVDRADLKRRQAEESAKQLAAIVRSSNDAIIGKTVDGLVTSWNPGAEAIYGYSEEEMIGQPVSRIIPPDRLDEFQAFLVQLRQGEAIPHYETERVRKDGNRIPVSISISPLKDEEGKIIGASTIARDITERKQAEEEVRRAAQYARTLLEASLDPLVTIGKDGKIRDVNRATEHVTGCLRDQLIGTDFSNYFTEPEIARRGYESVFAQGAMRDYPLVIRATSGTLTDVVYNAAVFTNAAGEVDGVFAAARDITELKRADEEIRAMNRELEQRVEQRTVQLRESETRVLRKLDSILSPEGDLGKLELADILDMPAVQSLMDDLYTLVHVTLGVVDLQGKVLAVSGWQKICMQFHRVNPETCKNCRESDVCLSAGIDPGDFKIYKCKNNLWEMATPIMVSDQHMGNFYFGQFLFADEPVDYDLFRAQAKRYGFNEAEYLGALEEVPRLTRETVSASTAFLAKFTQLIRS